MSRARGAIVPVLLAILPGIYWASCSLRLHRSFHSNAWDLGVFTQVVWNTAHGRPFEYSFRGMSYVGDHWSPILFAFVPLSWLGDTAEGLLLAQAALLAVAVVPLYFAIRRSAGETGAVLGAAAYALNLGVSRAVSFDFHTEALAPVLAFTAVLGLVTGRPRLFVIPLLLLLTLKEDAVLLLLPLTLVAYVSFGWRRVALVVGGVGLAYAAVVSLVVMPLFRGGNSNPLSERYGYLGDSALGILAGIPAHPSAVWDHLATADAVTVVALLVITSGGALLLRPMLAIAGAPLVVLPLLSDHQSQSSFELHYLLVPATYALCCLALHLHLPPERWWLRDVRPPARLVLAAVAAVSLLVFADRSPLPPSDEAFEEAFNVDDHARLAQSFVEMIPGGAVVSAQPSYVPHLAERRHIYTFPRLVDAEYVLVDLVAWDPDTGYEACVAALPRLGFRPLRQEDSIQLWRREAPAKAVPEAPGNCSGQHRE
ncbi:MAG: DUF2079 domain-containing protein [Chloroflexi bacterium]|nr:DUF2079 domain-containing protein [Chloroflexota bacterium]